MQYQAYSINFVKILTHYKRMLAYMYVYLEFGQQLDSQQQLQWYSRINKS